LERLPGYRAALYFSIALALTNLVGWGFILAKNPHLTTNATATAILIIPFLISFGLWVQSVIVRSLGVFWMLFWAAALIWPVVSKISRLNSDPALTVFFLICAVLNLLTAALLILSKKFRTEFTYERKHLPKYKTYLTWSVFSALIGAALIATFIDIINLASSP
jgi:hypothetical protein